MIKRSIKTFSFRILFVGLFAHQHTVCRPVANSEHYRQIGKIQHLLTHGWRSIFENEERSLIMNV